MKPFKLIFLYARNYIPSLTITAFSMLALVSVQLLIPWIVRTLIAAVTDPGLPTNVMKLVNHTGLEIDRAAITDAFLVDNNKSIVSFLEELKTYLPEPSE